MKKLLTYSKLRAKVLGFDFVQTLDELINEIFDKHSSYSRIGTFETALLLPHIIQDIELNFYDYLKTGEFENTFEELANLFVLIKRNDTTIEALGFEANKTKDLKKIYSAYNNFLRSRELADGGDVERFALEFVQKDRISVITEPFENDYIHFFTSKLQKKIYEAFDKEIVHEELKPQNTQNRYRLPSYDIFKEVENALILAKELENVKIVVSDIESYYEVFEALAPRYGLQVHSTRGEPLSKVLHRYPYKKEQIEFEAKKLHKHLARWGIQKSVGELKKKLLQSQRVLEKIGVEITETNQVYLYDEIENLIFVGASFEHFPPSRSSGIFTPKDETLFFFNDTYESSLSIYDRMRKIAKNFYVIYQENDLTKQDLSIIIDKDEFEKMELQPVKQLLQKPKSGASSCKTEVKHLSASRLNTYIACPRQYYYKYILELQSPSFEESELEASDKGTIMHKAFELVVQDGAKKSALEYANEAYSAENVEENVYTILYKKQLIKMLQKFIPYAKTLRNSLVEQRFYLDKELKPCEKEEHFIVGFIDRLDVNDEITIVDYKSSKKDGVDTNRVEEIIELKDLQLGLYALWAKQKYGKRVNASLVTFNTDNEDVDYVEFASLKECEEPEVKRNKMQYACYDIAYEESLKERIMEVKADIELGKFDTAEDVDCTWCDFKKICKKDIFLRNKIA